MNKLTVEKVLSGVTNNQSCFLSVSWGGVIAVTIAMMILTLVSVAYSMSGREIYENVHAVRSKALDRKTEITMVLFDKGGGKRTRTLTEFSKKVDTQAYKILVVFNSPADLKDVGFLIHARTFADRDIWAYFPEYKRIRRIPTNSQDDSFFGSDFSYDDFSGPPNLEDYSFKILSEEVLDGKSCYVVEVIPKVKRKYTRYIAWIAKDLWIHMKIEYYQEDELYREGIFKDIKIIDGIPTPFKANMVNKKSNHATELTIENIKYNTNHPDGLFTQRSLEGGEVSEK
ncbi:outer membrane lipoprotein-sorting protein [Candidatus Desantisbacteria bacterium]|nr:outer membrane lipoprotein-sorting protein [Candidatus Desantisbacteria bacterium]